MEMERTKKAFSLTGCFLLGSCGSERKCNNALKKIIMQFTEIQNHITEIARAFKDEKFRSHSSSSLKATDSSSNNKKKVTGGTPSSVLQTDAGGLASKTKLTNWKP